ncbi:hypothetical protein LOK49_LG06G00575 [Camellia lanceoleosa]|uniref:Uncharacterized protein n=1 Tax=Camellia lanceoleosa TaxID=1840588 RepID=A0ACC0HEQ4_9ERIC|nr:hypothetical protein LOK49_LG06G00575 [Camellia lanceoleosa]
MYECHSKVGRATWWTSWTSSQPLRSRLSNMLNLLDGQTITPKWAEQHVGPPGWTTILE